MKNIKEITTQYCVVTDVGSKCIKTETQQQQNDRHKQEKINHFDR